MTVKELCEACQQIMEHGKGDFEVVVTAMGFENRVTDWFDDDNKKILFLDTEYME